MKVVTGVMHKSKQVRDGDLKLELKNLPTLQIKLQRIDQEFNLKLKPIVRPNRREGDSTIFKIPLTSDKSDQDLDPEQPRSNNETAIKCPSCGRAILQRSSRVHINAHGKEFGSHGCHLCTCKFKTVATFRQHLVKIHGHSTGLLQEFSHTNLESR